jgi:hypothetical protein
MAYNLFLSGTIHLVLLHEISDVIRYQAVVSLLILSLSHKYLAMFTMQESVQWYRRAHDGGVRVIHKAMKIGGP